MAISIDGFSESHTRIIEKWCIEALFDLEDEDYDLAVTPVPIWEDPNIHARATSEGIQLAPYLFTDYTSRRIRRFRLGFLIHEEIAHHVLGKAGVPHGPRSTIEAFVQETFATWYWTSKFFVPGRLERHEFMVPVIPATNGHYQLGSVLGGALGGVRKARRALDQWKSSVSESPEKQMLKSAEEELTPPLVVEDVVDFYEELRHVDRTR